MIVTWRIIQTIVRRCYAKDTRELAYQPKWNRRCRKVSQKIMSWPSACCEKTPTARPPQLPAGAMYRENAPTGSSSSWSLRPTIYRNYHETRTCHWHRGGPLVLTMILRIWRLMRKLALRAKQVGKTHWNKWQCSNNREVSRCYCSKLFERISVGKTIDAWITFAAANWVLKAKNTTKRWINIKSAHYYVMLWTWIVLYLLAAGMFHWWYPRRIRKSCQYRDTANHKNLWFEPGKTIHINEL